MPKLKRLTTYMGATLAPIYQHMQIAHFRISPYDKAGNKMAKMLYKNFLHGDKRLKIETFNITLEVDHQSRDTCLEATFSEFIRKSMEK